MSDRRRIQRRPAPRRFERRQPKWRNYLVHGLLVIIIAEATYIAWLIA